MQAGIRIIKRGAQNGINGVSGEPVEKSARDREREAVDTVKAWVADWEERKRALQSAAAALIRSIESGRESSTKRFIPRARVEQPTRRNARREEQGQLLDAGIRRDCDRAENAEAAIAI